MKQTENNNTTEKSASSIPFRFRVYALAGVIFLVSLYVFSIVFAVIGTPWATKLLGATLMLTIIIPVILYGLIMFKKLLSQNRSTDDLM